MNREKIRRLEETIRKLKKSNRACKRRTRALRKNNKKVKRKLEEFKIKKDSELKTKEMCSMEEEENNSCHPKFSEAVANSSNKFSLDLYKEVLREKLPPKGGIVASLVDNLLGEDKVKRVGDLVMSGLSFSIVSTMLRGPLSRYLRS